MAQNQLRERIEKYLKEEAPIPYHEELGDTSNPDYVGPLAIKEMTDRLIEIFQSTAPEKSAPER